LPIILLQDVIDLRQRKREELEYYSLELQKLIDKMQLVKREIHLTECIIDMIEREAVIDLQRTLRDRQREDDDRGALHKQS
jgi:hypothetical protein